jgi:hypothetical protein
VLGGCPFSKKGKNLIFFPRINSIVYFFNQWKVTSI